MDTLQQCCADHQIKIDCKRSEAPPDSDWGPGSSHWLVTLTLDGRTLTTSFHQGSAHKPHPKAYEVLSCLLSDGQAGAQSFEDFCSDFGVDTDSRKAYATWEACVKINADLAQWFGRPGLRARFERSEQP